MDSSGFDFIFNERNLRKFYKRKRLEFLIETPTDPEDVWELVCTETESHMEDRGEIEPLACQETFGELEENVDYKCMNDCKQATDSFIFATTVNAETNKHYFKENSSVCQSLTFSGLDLSQTFKIFEIKSSGSYTPILRNEIISLPSSSTSVTYTFTSKVLEQRKCFDYLNFEKARDAENKEVSEIWATNSRGDYSEHSGEIYGYDRRWEARHAFTKNPYLPIPWAAALGDKEAKLSIDMKGIFEISRLEFTKVISVEEGGQALASFYCNFTQIYESVPTVIRQSTFLAKI